MNQERKGEKNLDADRGIGPDSTGAPLRQTVGPPALIQLVPALNSGGVERGTLEVARAAAERGWRSVVISGGGRLVEALEREGSRHIRCLIGKKSPVALLSVPRLMRLAKAYHPAVFHARSRMPAWVTFLAWRGIPKDFRPVFLTTVHGLHSVNPYSAIMTRGQAVIAVSQTARDYVLRHYPRTPRQRIHLIHRGVDPVEFPRGYRPGEPWLGRWRADYPQLQDKKVLVLAGRVTRLKGHLEFLRLIDKLKERGQKPHGLVIGEVQRRSRAYLDELRRAARDLKLENDVSFLGYRPDVKQIYATADLVVSLSRKPESFGRSILEPLCLGIRAAGYGEGGVGEVLAAMFPRGMLPRDDFGMLLDRVQALLREDAPKPEPNAFPRDRWLSSELDLCETMVGRRPTDRGSPV